MNTTHTHTLPCTAPEGKTCMPTTTEGVYWYAYTNTEYVQAHLSQEKCCWDMNTHTHYTKEYTMHGITVFFNSMLELGEFISINSCIDGLPFIEEAHACWVESKDDPKYPILCMQVESAGTPLVVAFEGMNKCSHCGEMHTYDSFMCQYGVTAEDYWGEPF